MVVAQKVKEAVTEQDSLLLTRNLLRIAIFNISYIRGLFPEKYFNDKSVPALEMKIKKLMPIDAESRRLIDWMEKGVYDTLQKKYLKTLLFCVCEAIDGPMIEEYAFSFCYSNSDSQEVSMNINRTGSRKQGGMFKYNSNTEVTPNQMKSSACKMIRTLVTLMRTLDRMPEERTIIMKLLYYDNVTPVDYEPPFFRGCTDEEAQNPWTKSPLKMEVGNVNSKHFVLALKVKSVLDPCEEVNDEMEDNEVSLGADSVQTEDYYDTDSEVDQSQPNQYVVAPIAEQKPQEDSGMVDEDDTQDEGEDELQLARVKDWISHLLVDSIEVIDVLSNFPDISAGLIEDIMDKLVKECFLLKSARGTYTINKQKIAGYEFTYVKDETNGQTIPIVEKSQLHDHMYMKALYHTLPMNHVTVKKLQSKLKGEANPATVRKIIAKMTKDGFLASTSNRRLGKRVIHSNLTKNKLKEIKKALGSSTMDADANDLHDVCSQAAFHTMGRNNEDMSTCGAFHSIGSDLTRMRGRSEMLQHGPAKSPQTISKTSNGNTPTSRAEPVASRESFTAGKENCRTNGDSTNGLDMTDAVIYSESSQEKRLRKTSTVKEPILPYAKRQKSAV